MMKENAASVERIADLDMKLEKVADSRRTAEEERSKAALRLQMMTDSVKISTSQ